MKLFNVAAIFSNHCVLQREKPICIFGECKVEILIKVELMNCEGTVICENQTFSQKGSWKLFLPSVPAQENCRLKVSCKDDFIEFCDISIGEVWLAGGQSNMEFELGNCTEGPKELEEEKAPNVRFYYTQKKAWKDDDFFESERNTSWQVWGDRWTKSWSAVGYFYAKKLAGELGVTVGVIGCNWGGTSASAWVDESNLEKDEDLKTYLDEYAEAEKGKSIEQQIKEFDDYEKFHAEWQKKCDALYKENPNIEWAEVQKIIGVCQWPGPKCCKNPFRPAGLYECMLQRVMPYSLKGFIYYQGESDDHKPNTYYKLFTTLIDKWRSDWNDDSLPFLYVQLPMHRYKQDKDFKNWCIIREAQLKVFKTIKNTGMICAADLGQFNDIHPKAKKVLAERMADLSLTSVYKAKSGEDSYAPIPCSSIVNGNSITITFENAEKGFLIKSDEDELLHYKDLEKLQGNELPSDFTGFEAAGTDEVFSPCTFILGDEETGLNTITLTSQKVKEIKYARYCWYNYGPVTIFSKSGIPLVPFRIKI